MSSTPAPVMSYYLSDLLDALNDYKTATSPATAARGLGNLGNLDDLFADLDKALLDDDDLFADLDKALLDDEISVPATVERDLSGLSVGDALGALLDALNGNKNYDRTLLTTLLVILDNKITKNSVVYPDVCVLIAYRDAISKIADRNAALAARVRNNASYDSSAHDLIVYCILKLTNEA